MVSRDQTFREVVVDLQFSRGIMEGIRGIVWGVSEALRSYRGPYVREHIVQHKPVGNVVTLLLGGSFGVRYSDS